MTVMVMEVKSVNQHLNADALKVYAMQAPGCPAIQIIANLERVYEVGDRISIAQVNSVLKDGTKIKATRLRGLVSYGMALGKTDAPVGQDLSDLYCQKSVAQSVQLQRWPSMELLYNVRRNLIALDATPVVTYRAKIKLDGTNAGVQVFSDGRVAAQSRSQIITPGDDNMGFAHWVSQHIDYFARLAGREHLTLFGEWCGQGIQKRTAISQIDRKIFAVFAVQTGGVENEVAKLEVDPEKIAELLPAHPDVFVLPFMGEPLTLDYGSRDQLESAATAINQLVTEVEHTDPWVKDTFGIEGLGEGVVLYPQSIPADRLTYPELMFKAKGEKHQVVKTKKPVQLDPERVKSIDQFVDLVVTSARLEQGVTEACSGCLEISQMGAFLKWLAMDVQKESGAELEVAQLSWKDVNRAVTDAGKKWFRDRVMSVGVAQ
ncbi:Phenylalanine--tRNA ligase beta subunit [Acaryochloris thomasi RCC1774]|uniref:Phenylalanine--tRNA ligase beta subunit n=1 Tax=Acaryochloris thomasi RCC1774 TaxID=1764569 RepID=A0A2W1JFL2_9CYAN|nr:RNA ligase family protein [Acaryochloris thomasi]PZD72388.1 Phenylalanine--tRNA ligase beta subunit [Acaryochloris thomasi RCC1774]